MQYSFYDGQIVWTGREERARKKKREREKIKHYRVSTVRWSFYECETSDRYYDGINERISGYVYTLYICMYVCICIVNGHNV